MQTKNVSDEKRVRKEFPRDLPYWVFKLYDINVLPSNLKKKTKHHTRRAKRECAPSTVPVYLFGNHSTILDV